MEELPKVVALVLTPIDAHLSPINAGTRDSEGFFTHLTDVLKEGLGRYFSGRPELKIIAEPGILPKVFYLENVVDKGRKEGGVGDSVGSGHDDD